MGHDDLDRKLLERLRWQTATSPEELARLLEAPAAEEKPAPKAKAKAQPEENLPAKSRALSAELAREVLALWARPGEARAAAVLALAHKIGDAGFFAFGFGDHPLAAIRMLRLLMRYQDEIPPQVQHGVTLALPAGVEPHPELADLIVELAESCNGAVHLGLGLNHVDEEPRFRSSFAEAAPRLAALIENPSADPASRVMAARLIGSAPASHAAPALRRALRSRLFALREAALSALLDYEESPLTAEDVLWLLEDAERHELPDGRELSELGYYYVNELDRAVAAVRPAGGAEILVRIARGDADLMRGFGKIHDGWALGALAAAWPERAVPLIDTALRNSRLWTRRDAIEAASRLPWELARPRLLLGAADGAQHVSERARDAWRHLQQSACPVEPTDGLCLELLEGPPSEDLLRRLIILRGDVQESKHKLVPLLIDEAPSREALVLLLFVLEDDSTYGPVLPPNAEKCAELLYERFGPLAIDGLAAMGLRRPLGWDHGFRMLDKIAQRKDLPEAQRLHIRALAGRCYLELKPEEREGPRALMATVGAPLELVPDLLEAAARGDRDSWQASTALTLNPEAEAPVVAALREAAHAGDWKRMEELGMVAARARWESARALLVELIEQAPGDVEAAAGAARRVGAELLQAGWVDEARRWSWISDPTKPRFLPAANRFKPEDPEALARVRAALEAALDTTALQGQAAALAAAELLDADRVDPADPRILRALRGADHSDRRRILMSPAFHSEPGEHAEPIPESKYLRRIWLTEGRRPRHRMTAAVQDELVRLYVEAEHDPYGVGVISDELSATEEGLELLERARAASGPYMREEIALSLDERIPRERYWEDVEEGEDDDEEIEDG